MQRCIRILDLEVAPLTATLKTLNPVAIEGRLRPGSDPLACIVVAGAQAEAATDQVHREQNYTAITAWNPVAFQNLKLGGTVGSGTCIP